MVSSLVCLSKPATRSRERCNDAQTSNSSRSGERISQTVVIDETSSQLCFWRKVVDRFHRVSDLIDHLQRNQYGLPFRMTEHRLTSFSYGTPRNADGKRFVKVVCTMADVAETPQTVPKDRMRYTVEAETAWSDKQHMSVLSCLFFEAVDLPA